MLPRLLLAALLALSSGAAAALAQTAPPVPPSDLMISWRSNGLAPAGYAGRVAAAKDGSVLLLAEALVGGVPANLRGYEVRWFIDDELYQSGMGLQSVTYRVPEFHKGSLEARVEIVDAPFAANEGTITVPLTDPEASIEGPRDGKLRTGRNRLVVTPYSFNVASVTELTYDWTVNGVLSELTENPRELILTVSGTPVAPVQINVGVVNMAAESERTTASTVLAPER